MNVCFRVMAALIIFGCSGCDNHTKYTIDESLLADVPLSEKQAMLKVKEEQTQFQQVQLQADSEVSIAQRDLAAANEEEQIAKLQIATVQADFELAKSTKDLNRIDRAKARLSVAELGHNNAATKVDWRKLRLSYAEHQVPVLKLQVQEAEARYEQEKAKLAAANGKRPYENFSVRQFDRQVAQAQARWDKERAESDKLKQAILQVEGRYQKLQDELIVARTAAPSQAVPPAPPF